MLTGIAVSDGASSALDWEARHNSRMENMARQMMSGMGSLALSGRVGDCCDEEEVRPFLALHRWQRAERFTQPLRRPRPITEPCFGLMAPFWSFRAADEAAGGLAHCPAAGVVANITGVLCSSPTCTRERRSRQSTRSRQQTRSTTR